MQVSAADRIQHGNDLLIVQPEEATLAKAVNSECGFVAKGVTDGEVIEMIRGHMTTDHPALLATVDRGDLYGWIEEI